MEWDELCCYVSRFASTAAGKKACRELRRGRDVEEALMLQAETRAVDVLASQLKVEFSFGMLSTDLVSGALKRCARGGMLSAAQVGSIAALISAGQVQH